MPQHIQSPRECDPTSIPAALYLARWNIPFTIFKHTRETHSLEQAAAERGQDPRQIIRSILFRLSKTDFVLVLVAGSKQVSWKKLRRYLGQSRLTLAGSTEVKEHTGSLPGAVSPFGLPKPLRILADRSILIPPEVSLGSGIRGIALILTRENLLKALENVEFDDFSTPE